MSEVNIPVNVTGSKVVKKEEVELKKGKRAAREIAEMWVKSKDTKELVKEVRMALDRAETRACELTEQALIRLMDGRYGTMEEYLDILRHGRFTDWKHMREMTVQLRARGEGIGCSPEEERQQIVAYLTTSGLEGHGIKDGKIVLGMGKVKLEDRGLEVELGPFTIEVVPIGTGWPQVRGPGLPRSDEHIHPHVGGDGSICWGDGGGRQIDGVWKQRDFIGIIESVRAVLRTYSRRNPFVKLEVFADILGMKGGGRCGVCEQWGDIDKMKKCKVCKRLVCEGCGKEEEEKGEACQVCEKEGKVEKKKGGFICKGCKGKVPTLYPCSICGKKLCPNHTRVIAGACQYGCEKCVGRCEVCGSYLAKGDLHGGKGCKVCEKMGAWIKELAKARTKDGS